MHPRHLFLLIRPIPSSDTSTSGSLHIQKQAQTLSITRRRVVLLSADVKGPCNCTGHVQVSNSQDAAGRPSSGNRRVVCYCDGFTFAGRSIPCPVSISQQRLGFCECQWAHVTSPAQAVLPVAVAQPGYSGHQYCRLPLIVAVNGDSGVWCNPATMSASGLTISP